MSVIANRYIQALLELPKSKDENEKIEEGLKEIASVYNSNEQLKKVLLDPRIVNEVKMEIVNEIFSQYMKVACLKNFVELLIKEKRINYIQEIAEIYEKVTSEAKKELNIKIIVAKPIDEKQTEAIVKKYKTMYKVETINYEVVIDESLLGGVKVMVGNKIYDGSVATQLEQMF